MSYIRVIFNFFYDFYKNKTFIIDFSKNNFKSRYMGSYLGILWAFIQPLVMIIIFWFVFEVGFKSNPVDDFPFILWLMAGMIPWLFFADGVQSSINSIMLNAFLVKKIAFKVYLLPVVQIITSLIIHMVFVLLLIIIFLYYGYSPTIYWLQVPYYIFCSLFLLLGLSWFVSSVVIFFKDLEQIISMFIQFGFWLTPIFWSVNMLPENYHIFIKYNPVYYIIDGFRDCFINNVWVWDKPYWAFYYWLVSGIVMIVGAIVFKKLRPHFADVL